MEHMREESIMKNMMTGPMLFTSPKTSKSAINHGQEKGVLGLGLWTFGADFTIPNIMVTTFYGNLHFSSSFWPLSCVRVISGLSV
jgi:hypothetical protein